MRTLYLAIAAALLLHGPAHSQAPAPVNLETVRPIAGTWSYAPVAAGTQATFRDASSAPRLMVTCNRATRAVTVTRMGVAAAAPTLSIWTSTTSRSVAASFHATGQLSATIHARDPLLDAVAFSRGRFATGAAGAQLVAVPAGPEPARVIEDCRS